MPRVRGCGCLPRWERQAACRGTAVSGSTAVSPDGKGRLRAGAQLSPGPRLSPQMGKAGWVQGHSCLRVHGCLPRWERLLRAGAQLSPGPEEGATAGSALQGVPWAGCHPAPQGPATPPLSRPRPCCCVWQRAPGEWVVRTTPLRAAFCSVSDVRALVLGFPGALVVLCSLEGADGTAGLPGGPGGAGGAAASPASPTGPGPGMGAPRFPRG